MFTVIFQATDPKETIGLFIDGLPLNFELIPSSENPNLHLEVQESDVDVLKIIAPPNYNGEFMIDVIGTSIDLTGSDVATVQQSQLVRFLPANDPPM